LNTPQTRTLCIAGADAEVAARITALLDELRTRLDDRWRIADYASADLLLIQTDSVYGHMDWLKAEGNGRLVAALTSNPDAYGFALAFPVTPAGVTTLLNGVSARLAGRPAPAVAKEAAPAAAPARPAPAVHAVAPPAPAAPAARAEAAARPAIAETAHSHSLLDLLEGRTAHAGKLQLQAEGLPELLVDTRAGQWHSAATLKGLAPWCTHAIGAADVRVLDDAVFARQAATLQAHPLARLAWLVHLVSHDGRLRPGLDPKAPYKLAKWPQSEREFPKHFRIATVMLKQAHTLEEIAAESGAGVADVANFINAYDALGYVERLDAPANDARGGGLFGRAKKTGAMS